MNAFSFLLWVGALAVAAFCGLFFVLVILGAIKTSNPRKLMRGEAIVVVITEDGEADVISSASYAHTGAALVELAAEYARPHSGGEGAKHGTTGTL